MLLDVITVAAHLKTAVINPNSYFFQDNLLCKLRHKSNIYRPFSFIAALKYAGLIYHFLTWKICWLEDKEAVFKWMTQIGLSNTFHDYCYSVSTLVQEWIRMASKKLCLLWRLFLTRPKGWTLLKASQASKPSFSAAAQLLLLQHAACSLKELLRQLCFLLLFAETLSYISAPIILVLKSWFALFLSPC